MKLNMNKKNNKICGEKLKKFDICNFLGLKTKNLVFRNNVPSVLVLQYR